MLFPIRKIAEFNYKILQNILYTGNTVSKWDKPCSAFCCVCRELETPRHLLFDCIKVKRLWENVKYILQHKTEWKNIVTGLYQTNIRAQVINVCISIVTYSIFAGWSKCKITGKSYEKLDIENSCLSRISFYGEVLLKTNKFNLIGNLLCRKFNQ